MTRVTLVWLQNDLRVHDHPALHTAADRGAVVPIYIDASGIEGSWQEGAASAWWRHRSLLALDESLRRRGSPLVVARGDPARVLLETAASTGATRVHWTRRHEPEVQRAHAKLRSALVSGGLEVEIHGGQSVFDPEAISTRAGTPFQVFTPFWEAALANASAGDSLPAPKRLSAPPNPPASLPLDALAPHPLRDWHSRLASHWVPGEVSARKAFVRFLDEGLADYADRRDLPAIEGSSRLSPHLHFGEISAREMFLSLQPRAAGSPSARKFLSELGWREFAHHLLHHYPRTPDSPWRKDFEDFPWNEEPGLERAWQRGLTGIPIVDAGQRELWATGWMHNRVRMISASLLVKNLGVHWLRGARWFWDTLVDADLANNTLGWQWTAGCGADAAPYFRVFNPVLQGQRYDAAGEYVRRWIPELAPVPDEYLHEPWRAPAPPRGYPAPIVDLRASRNEALRAYEEHRRAGK